MLNSSIIRKYDVIMSSGMVQSNVSQVVLRDMTRLMAPWAISSKLQKCIVIIHADWDDHHDSDLCNTIYYWQIMSSGMVQSNVSQVVLTDRTRLMAPWAISSKLSKYIVLFDSATNNVAHKWVEFTCQWQQFHDECLAHLKHSPNDHNTMIYDTTDMFCRYISDIEFTLGDHLCVSLESVKRAMFRTSGH